MKAPYVFHPAAEQELREIIRYTRKNWGDAQAKKYAAKLREYFQALATGKQPGKDMSELYPALRVAYCESHYVFYLSRQNAPALIIAILHERMDLMTRLQNRLNS